MQGVQREPTGYRTLTKSLQDLPAVFVRAVLKPWEKLLQVLFLSVTDHLLQVSKYGIRRGSLRRPVAPL